MRAEEASERGVISCSCAAAGEASGGSCGGPNDAYRTGTIAPRAFSPYATGVARKCFDQPPPGRASEAACADRGSAMPSLPEGVELPKVDLSAAKSFLSNLKLPEGLPALPEGLPSMPSLPESLPSMPSMPSLPEGLPSLPSLPDGASLDAAPSPEPAAAPTPVAESYQAMPEY